MSQINEHIQKNKERFLEELFSLIRIPSISANPQHKSDMQKTAELIRDMLLEAGADEASVLSTDGHPVVFGQKKQDPSLPTILVYGHYDVQPAEPLELWKSPPFEPEIRDEKIFARGADDDKGQFFMHLKAFEAMVKTNNLPCNVKFLVEGEEEIGSASLPKFCEKNKDMLAADVILVSDTTLVGEDIPSITTGLRGITYYDIKVTGPNRDLHSGLYGGAVANPLNALAEIVAKLKNDKQQVTMPGFYDKVQEVSEFERKELARAPFDEAAYKNALNVDDLMGEQGYSTIERTGIRPSLDLCGMWGGYTGEGAKTVLPSEAFAKVSMRLVPNQDPDEIDEKFPEYVKSLAPKGVHVEVTPLHSGRGYVAPIDSVAYKAASKAMEKTFGKKPVPTRSGGSIPVISDFESILGIKSILMGFGLESDAIHSPNENYPLKNFFLGIETIPLFYKYFTDFSKEG
ncbi:MAG: dipeptidase [Bacteroidota bacterium]